MKGLIIHIMHTSNDMKLGNDDLTFLVRWIMSPSRIDGGKAARATLKTECFSGLKTEDKSSKE